VHIFRCNILSGDSSNKNPKANVTSRFSLVENDQACLVVLDEFVCDVEAAVEGSCESDWPDLFREYLKARQLVRDTDRACQVHDEPAVVAVHLLKE
jgi:hypothetical protein